MEKKERLTAIPYEVTKMIKVWYMDCPKCGRKIGGIYSGINKFSKFTNCYLYGRVYFDWSEVK